MPVLLFFKTIVIFYICASVMLCNSFCNIFLLSFTLSVTIVLAMVFGVCNSTGCRIMPGMFVYIAMWVLKKVLVDMYAITIAAV